MKVKKSAVIFSILAAIAFLINGILWFMSGSKLAGILFLFPAILFLTSGIIQIIKLKKEKNK